MFDSYFDPKSVAAYREDIERLFGELEREVSDSRNYRKVTRKIQQGLKENRAMLLENNIGYAQVKQELKSDGLINETTPLAVTGQLIADFGIVAMEHSPDEILQHFGFKSIERSRPTIDSMYSVARGNTDELTYRDSNSMEVAEKLEKVFKMPIARAIYDQYNKDLYRHAKAIINRVFKKIG